jgi:hypothetical protein
MQRLLLGLDRASAVLTFAEVTTVYRRDRDQHREFGGDSESKGFK